MKNVLIVLILYLSINVISAFSWFNLRSNEQPKQVFSSVNTYHASDSSLQRVLNQRQYHIRNTTVFHRQAGRVNKTSSQIMHRNRLKAIAHEQQHRSLNNSVPFHQAHFVVNNTRNRTVHPRFRSSLRIGKKNQTGVSAAGQRTFSQASLSKYVAVDSKPNSSSSIHQNILSYRSQSARLLLQALATKATGNNDNQNRRRISANSYYQQQSRTFYNATRTRPIINSALRRRKRQNVPSEAFYSMIFSRVIPPSGITINLY